VARRARTARKPNPPHNHAQCVRSALQAADRVCAKRAIRLTPLRRRILELVWAQHDPIGAYDILDKLVNDYRKPAPPTVYRALEFLIDAGLVHRIESLNAFKGCASPEQAHRAQFLVCRACHRVEEIDDRTLERAIETRALNSGFRLEAESFEVKGLCGQCATEA